MKGTHILAVIFTLTATLILPVNAQGGSITATLTEDTYYDFFYAQQPYNKTYTWLETTFKVSLRYTSFLKFDLSSIPNGAEDIMAVLELYTAVDGVPISHSVEVWSHNDITWDEEVRLPSPDYEHNTKKLDTTWVASSERWYEWNVTNAIVEAVSNSSGAVTFMVTYPSGQNVLPVSFLSKEGSMTKIPKLTVTWNSIIPEFSSHIILTLLIVTLTLLAMAVKKQIYHSAIHKNEI